MPNTIETEERHERHGVCLTCWGDVHEYPFGIAHVNRPTIGHVPGWTNAELETGITWTCCDEHALGGHR